MSTGASKSRPRVIRLLIADATRIGNGTATGQLKATLLRGLEGIEVAQLSDSGLERIGFSGTINGRSIDAAKCTQQQIDTLTDEFDPHCILYRPTPENQSLHGAAMRIIRSRPLPLITWIMDDWPARLREADAAKYDAMTRDLEWLFQRSSRCLCISEKMQTAFEARYGVDFLPIANGVDAGDWPRLERPEHDVLSIRYAGSMAEDMTLASLLDVAQAVQRLADLGFNTSLQINTRKTWAHLYGHRFRKFSSCRVTSNDLSDSEYRSFLQNADVQLIAYNFDDRSARYVQYSLANKLPECLISGAPLLVYGPTRIATVAFMAEHLPETVVSEPDISVLADKIEAFASSRSKREQIAERGREIALSRFQLENQQAKLRDTVHSACEQPYRHEIRYASRDARAHIDECRIVAAILNDDGPETHVMIDVGAHYGSSLSPFAERGWFILAFEPDQENRAVLERRYGGHPDLVIDPRAVTDTEAPAQVFYSSSVSTGIRGLLPFHESHHEAASVQVTTLAASMAELGIERVDFLKIDVEGYDLAVLRGFPWASLQPDAVVCEFEDSKTLQLGHRWQDIAEFLAARGYAVYVSEWYPIVRYGIRHDWRSLRAYPCELEDADSWGNLIAFRVRPLDADLARAVTLSLKQESSVGTHVGISRFLYRVGSLIRVLLRRARARLR